jgi:hypothetical protein
VAGPLGRTRVPLCPLPEGAQAQLLARLPTRLAEAVRTRLPQVISLQLIRRPQHPFSSSRLALCGLCGRMLVSFCLPCVFQCRGTPASWR